MNTRVAAALECVFALAELVRVTWLYQARGRRAVARRTHALMVRSDEGRADVAVLRRSVRALARAEWLWPRRVSCLKRALVLHALLERHGIASSVRVGVRMADGELDGHAWLKVGDLTIDPDRMMQSFVAFAEPSSESRVS